MYLNLSITQGYKYDEHGQKSPSIHIYIYIHVYIMLRILIA